MAANKNKKTVKRSSTSKPGRKSQGRKNKSLNETEIKNVGVDAIISPANKSLNSLVEIEVELFPNENKENICLKSYSENDDIKSQEVTSIDTPQIASKKQNSSKKLTLRHQTTSQKATPRHQTTSQKVTPPKTISQKLPSPQTTSSNSAPSHIDAVDVKMEVIKIGLSNLTEEENLFDSRLVLRSSSPQPEQLNEYDLKSNSEQSPGPKHESSNDIKEEKQNPLLLSNLHNEDSYSMFEEERSPRVQLVDIISPSSNKRRRMETHLNESSSCGSKVNKKNTKFKCQNCSFDSSDQQELLDHMLCHVDVTTLQPLDRHILQKVEVSLTKQNNKTKNKKILQKPKNNPKSTENNITINQTPENKRITSPNINQIIENLKAKNLTESKIKRNIEKNKKVRSMTKHPEINQITKKIRHKRIYLCNSCDFKTKRKRSLVHHFYLHMNDCTQIRCEKCNYECKDKVEFNEHMKKHTEQIYKCVVCNFKTEFKKDLENHTIVHDGEALDHNQYKCDICDFKTKSKIVFNRHALTHKANKLITCEMCNYKTHHNDELKLHMESHKLDNKTFECPRCDYTTIIKRELTMHVRKHIDELNDTFPCPYCDYTTKLKTILDAHMLIHNTKTFSCSHCWFRTKSKKELKTHEKIHSKRKIPEKSKEHCDKTHKEQEFSCDICDYKSYNMEDLENHKNDTPHRSNKCHTCQHCDFKSAYKQNLARHYKSKHSG